MFSVQVLLLLMMLTMMVLLIWLRLDWGFFDMVNLIDINFWNGVYFVFGGEVVLILGCKMSPDLESSLLIPCQIRYHRIR